MQKEQTIRKADDRSAAADSADHGNQRARVTQSKHIHIVADDKKDAVTGITINPSELTIYPGDESRLSITVTPEKASYNADELVWESSDTSVVVVSQNGTVTAMQEGTANVTVTYKELKSVCQVAVSSWIKDIFFTGVFFGISDTSAYGEIIDTIQSIDGSDYYHDIGHGEYLCSTPHAVRRAWLGRNRRFPTHFSHAEGVRGLSMPFGKNN